MATPGDAVDRLVAQWAAERPDLDASELSVMATFGRLGRLLTFAGRAIDEVFEQHGLRTGEFDVLATLRRSGEPFALPPSHLARTLMLSAAGMTNRVDRLESDGLVSRRADPDDRRSSFVVLTPAGRQVVDAALADHLANEARLLSCCRPPNARPSTERCASSSPNSTPPPTDRRPATGGSQARVRTSSLASSSGSLPRRRRAATPSPIDQTATL